MRDSKSDKLAHESVKPDFIILHFKLRSVQFDVKIPEIIKYGEVVSNFYYKQLKQIPGIPNESSQQSETGISFLQTYHLGR